MAKAKAYLKAGKTTKSEVLVGGATKRLRRSSLYGPAVQQALITIWNASTFRDLSAWQEACCSSSRTKKARGHLHLEDETRRLLLQMSPWDDRKGVQEQEKRVAVVVWWR